MSITIITVRIGRIASSNLPAMLRYNILLVQHRCIAALPRQGYAIMSQLTALTARYAYRAMPRCPLIGPGRTQRRIHRRGCARNVDASSLREVAMKAGVAECGRQDPTHSIEHAARARHPVGELRRMQAMPARSGRARHSKSFFTAFLSLMRCCLELRATATRPARDSQHNALDILMLPARPGACFTHPVCALG
jgi:hypothetical protein